MSNPMDGRARPIARRPIIGSGGDDSNASSETRVAVEDPDSLQSHQYAKILDALSEGEIGGLVNGLCSVYLNEVPAMAADGTMNVSGITLVTRNGTNDQSIIEGFTDTENEIAVSSEIKYGVPKVVHISGNVDSARITLGLPRLTQQDTVTGDLHGSSVQVSILVQNNGGGFAPVICDTAWQPATAEGNVVTAHSAHGVGMTVVLNLPFTATDWQYSGGADGGADAGDTGSSDSDSGNGGDSGDGGE